MGHHVDGHRDSQNEGIVLALGNLHTVGVAKPEPLFQDLAHLPAALTDTVLVIQDIALFVPFLAPIHK